MEVKNIKSLNGAVYVLRHFVELSAQLLPVYEKITRKKITEKQFIEEKNKIDFIYSRHNVNPDVGRFLLGSDILMLISSAYESLKNRTAKNEEEAKKNLNDFIEEYIRLKQEWYLTLMN